VWAETGLVLADQFRDGNVPAQMEPREVAQRAFAALPGTVGEYDYRGDAACHESGLVNRWRDEQRPGGPRGHIGFTISARISEPLHAAIRVVPESAWQPYGASHPAEIRECADVPFVPSEKTEKKDSELLTARPKRLRFLLFNMPGRLVHHARRLILRVAAVGQWTAAYGEGLRSLPMTTGPPCKMSQLSADLPPTFRNSGRSAFLFRTQQTARASCLRLQPQRPCAFQGKEVSKAQIPYGFIQNAKRLFVSAD